MIQIGGKLYNGEYNFSKTAPYPLEDSILSSSYFKIEYKNIKCFYTLHKYNMCPTIGLK
jgi:hypothetical protein